MLMAILDLNIFMMGICGIATNSAWQLRVICELMEASNFTSLILNPNKVKNGSK